jgi:hypothetical protein
MDEFCLPPYEKRRGSQGDRGRGSGRKLGGYGDHCHEPIPPAVHGLDETRRPWIVP